MSRLRTSEAGGEARCDCIGCGTGIPLCEPILVKFRRCYYCGQHDPFGNRSKVRAAPAIIVVGVALIALLWTQLAS